MLIYNHEEFVQNKATLLRSMKKSIFIYPTDSIYGIGCDATNKELVQKIRALKNNTLQPFSVIAPSHEWVRQVCEVDADAQVWVKTLGSLADINGQKHAFSLVLPLKNPSALAPNVTQGHKTLSVRIPHHWFSQVVKELGVPIITTSANPTGGDMMTGLDDLHDRIRLGVDLIIYEGDKKGRPSTIINLTKPELHIVQR
jgi:L-threonylcarbamoyladenylate synthase